MSKTVNSVNSVQLSKDSYFGARQKAIRNKCIDCCGGDRREASACQIMTCPLWLFRTGKAVNPQEAKDQRKYMQSRNKRGKNND